MGDADGLALQVVVAQALLRHLIGHLPQQPVAFLAGHLAGLLDIPKQNLDIDLVVGAVDAGGVVDEVGVAAPAGRSVFDAAELRHAEIRSEEHTSELQSLMRISYAVFCLKKKKKQD